MDKILPIIVFVPMIIGFLLLFVPRKLNIIAKGLVLIISVVAFILAIKIYMLKYLSYSIPLLSIGNFSLDLKMQTTSLSNLMLIAVCGFSVLITLYSLRSVKMDVKRICEYYGAILLTIGGSMGILLSDHLLLLLICWEIVTAALYLLIASGRQNSNFAATKTFAMIGASDGALLIGIMMLWVITSTFTISDIRIPTDSALSITAFLLLVLAAITKAGAMPLHTWLPTSGEYSPVSVMALLPAAIDKLIGIYLLIIIVQKMFIITSAALSQILAFIGAATIVVTVMVAMVQHNLKKLLSYHAISQVGYMILGIATGTAVGIAGGVFHMLNHSIYKSCLFLCGGAVQQSANTTELEELGGLGKKMPVTFVTCIIAALSISGMPPLNGFASKWMVYQGIVQMGNQQTSSAQVLWPLWLLAAIFGSTLTLASFVKVIHSVFLSRSRDNLKDTKEVSFIQIIPMVILAALCLLLGIFYKKILRWFICPALGLESTNLTFGTWQSGLVTIFLIAAIFIGLLIFFIGKIKTTSRYVPTWYCGEKIENEKMIIPGTHFYKTVSNMKGFRQLYDCQAKGWFDLYNLAGKTGLTLTAFLRWMHSGLLPVYLTWVTLGLLLILFVVCSIW